VAIAAVVLAAAAALGPTAMAMVIPSRSNLTKRLLSSSRFSNSSRLPPTSHNLDFNPFSRSNLSKLRHPCPQLKPIKGLTDFPNSKSSRPMDRLSFTKCRPAISWSLPNQPLRRSIQINFISNDKKPKREDEESSPSLFHLE